jgi:hypothetical protein
MSGVNVHMGSRDEANPMDFEYVAEFRGPRLL